MRPELIAFRGNRSQEEIARHYNVSQQAWSKYERGIATPPPALMLQLEKDSKIKMEVLFFDAFNYKK